MNGRAGRSNAGFANRCVLTFGVAIGVAFMRLATAAPADAPPEPLRSIGEVLSLPIEEFDRKRPVIVRGVVTIVTPVVIQDGEDAIYVDPTRLTAGQGQGWKNILKELPMEVGAEIEVTGFVDPGGYAPRIVMQSVRRVGTQPLPEPVPVDVARLFAGGDAGRLVRATGVVQAVGENPVHWSLVFETAGRRLTLNVEKEVMPERPDMLVDAEVEVVGVGSTSRNTRGEFVAPGLHVARREDLRLVRERTEEPFALPMTPLGSIARYRSKPLGGHRLRTSGIISFVAPGMLYLQEGIGGVQVVLAAEPGGLQEFEPGDRVEVAGFPDMSSGVGAIGWAVVRKVDPGTPPQPLDIQPSEIIRINDAHGRSGEVARPGSYDGCLIRCRGRVEAVDRSLAAPVLALTDGDTVFTAQLAEAPEASPASFVVGSEVEITGIVQVARVPAEGARPTHGATRVGQLVLLVRGKDDVHVVRLPPWWTPSRLAAVAGLLGAIAAASVVWVTFLRREVARQTARAVAEESARQKAALDYEITLRERNQLAANLHDTALQTVTGIAFQLKVCDAKERERNGASGQPAGQEAGDEVARHLGVARKMVEHAADQLRGSVWSLRSLPTEGRTFSDAVHELVGRVGAGHAARVRIDFDARANAIAAYVAGNLLLVIQEALHNALHHADPRSVEVQVTRDGRGDVVAVVRDDGQGFEIGTQAGPRQGHFGLAGMRERAERLGGTLDIDSAIGQGTAVRASVPAVMPASEAAATADASVHA
jgi:signal transduction histidine kinase